MNRFFIVASVFLLVQANVNAFPLPHTCPSLNDIQEGDIAPFKWTSFETGEPIKNRSGDDSLIKPTPPALRFVRAEYIPELTRSSHCYYDIEGEHFGERYLSTTTLRPIGGAWIRDHGRIACVLPRENCTFEKIERVNL